LGAIRTTGPAVCGVRVCSYSGRAAGTIFSMHFVDLLIVAPIFDDIMIPEVQPRHCGKERAGNLVEWMDEAAIANDAEEHSLRKI
jgi:hypothetical protein